MKDETGEAEGWRQGGSKLIRSWGVARWPQMPLPSSDPGVGLLATFKKALVLDAARKQHGLLPHLRPDAVIWKCRAHPWRTISLVVDALFRILRTYKPSIQWYMTGLRRDAHSPPAPGRGGGQGRTRPMCERYQGRSRSYSCLPTRGGMASLSACRFFSQSSSQSVSLPTSPGKSLFENKSISTPRGAGGGVTLI